MNKYKHDYADVKYKIRNKIWNWFNPASGKKGRHYWCYRAWYCLQKKHITRKKDLGQEESYLTQKSHRASGIGVNFENIYSGYRAAKLFGLKYAYSPLPDRELDDFLALGSGEIKADELLNKGYKRIRLPYFEPGNEKEIEILKQMIHAYSGEKVVFYLEDQQQLPYTEELSRRNELLDKFWRAKARESDPIIFSTDAVHIVMHIRRGDIGEYNPKEGMDEWWLDNSYYVHIISSLLKEEDYRNKTTELYLVSEGEEELFSEIAAFAKEEKINIYYVLNQSVYLSWLYMIKADILLTGSSSFSYNAALFNRGVKISPRNRFLLPQDPSWYIAERDGTIVTLRE